MKLSSYPNFWESIDHELMNEQEFDALGLVASQLSVPHCIFIENEQYINDIKDTVTMVFTTKELASKLNRKERGCCIVEKPGLTFFKFHNYLASKQEYQRAGFKTQIDPTAVISPMASIAERNVSIGKNVKIEEFVVIRENTEIGDGTIIRSGTVIGGEGFEFRRDNDTIMPVIHTGGVKIGHNVEIRHNSVIDKGLYPWDDTVIGDESKIDSLVDIAHGVKIGRAVMIIASAAVMGRTVIEDESRIGPNAVVRNGILVGGQSVVSMGAVVTQNVPCKMQVSGNFAKNHKEFIAQLKGETS